MSRTETGGPSRVGNSSNDGSGFQGHSVDDNRNLSAESGLSEIEQLLKGKKFSRQVLHLVIFSVLLRFMACCIYPVFMFKFIFT